MSRKPCTWSQHRAMRERNNCTFDKGRGAAWELIDLPLPERGHTGKRGISNPTEKWAKDRKRQITEVHPYVTGKGRKRGWESAAGREIQIQ